MPNGDDHITYGYDPSAVRRGGVVDTIMNLCPCPHKAVLELFKNIDLSGSFEDNGFPSASGFGPGKFVFERNHLC